MVREVQGPQRLVELVGMVETKFPDEMSLEGVEEFRGTIEGLRERFGI